MTCPIKPGTARRLGIDRPDPPVMAPARGLADVLAPLREAALSIRELQATPRLQLPRHPWT